MSTPPSPNGQVRHQNMYAHHMWRQQRFFAGILVVIGIVATGILVFQGQLLKGQSAIYLLYVPSGLLLGGAFLYNRWRSHLRILDTGVRISTLTSHVDIPYDSIRQVRVQALRNHFLEHRSRMVVRAMKPMLDENALFIRLRNDDATVAIAKKLGTKLVNDDTIAIPVPDADAAAWSITARLPERIGQNLGGGKRRKKRR